VTVSACRVRHEPVHPAVGYRIDTPDGSIAISGDTLVCDEMAELADGVDVLVYEAMRFAVIEQLPEHRRFVLDYHADTRLIGEQARRLGVPTLVLTHLIPPPGNDEARQAFVDDIRGGGFEGELVVADDLDVVTLGRGTT
jgi:ribonuclease Z